MSCENEECPIRVFGKCSYAITVRAETRYFSVRKLWQSLAASSQVEEQAGQVDAASKRRIQLTNVRNQAEGYIKQYCRRKDYALRNAVGKLPRK
jgi:hypothetical protein